MNVTINRSFVIDEQEKLFQEVQESFRLFLEEYHSHWFRNFFQGSYCNLSEIITLLRIHKGWIAPLALATFTLWQLLTYSGLEITGGKDIYYLLDRLNMPDTTSYLNMANYFPI